MQAQKRIQMNRVRELAQRVGKYCKATKVGQATRQRKYDLTFLNPLRSGIVRATRSLHKLAESTNSDHNHWTFLTVLQNVFVKIHRKRKAYVNEFD